MTSRGCRRDQIQSNVQIVGTSLSVNVGLPKAVSWQGKTVFTGVFKLPVAGPQKVRRLNIDGDGQGDLAGHGFARSHLAVRWSDKYTTLLELAESCDVPVRRSCRTGVCHTCETSLISGQVAYRPDPVEPPADGSALICCAQPRGGLVLDL
jgi:ferredoxin